LEISLHTELSDNIDRMRLRGWVLYDASCPFCLNLLARVQHTLQASGFRPEPLQSSWVRDLLNLPEDQLLGEMRVLTRKGRVLGGADAVVYLANHIDAQARPWWAWLLVISGKMPLAMPVLRAAYGWIVARRPCTEANCPLAKSSITKNEGIQ
jgi:predicted DCC family thiol-disulfide oxidoreductase YuxK